MKNVNCQKISGLLFFLAFSSIISCKARNDDNATLKMANAVPISDPLNGVVKLMAEKDDGVFTMCTGTFVSETTVLTAAHCLGQHKNIRLFSKTGTPALWWASHPMYNIEDSRENGQNYVSVDLGVVLFPEGTASSWGVKGFHPLQKGAPSAGDVIIQMGFGWSKWDENNYDFEAITLKGGCSSIESVGDSFFTVLGLERANSTKDSTGIKLNCLATRSTTGVRPGEMPQALPGDSGSAVFDRTAHAIIGVTSCVEGIVDDPEAKRTYLTSFTSKSNLDFLKTMQEDCGQSVCAQLTFH